MIRGIPSEMDPQAGINMFFVFNIPTLGLFVCLAAIKHKAIQLVYLSIYLTNCYVTGLVLGQSLLPPPLDPYLYLPLHPSLFYLSN